MSNGSEFIAHITNDLGKMHDIDFKYLQSGKPTQNAFLERFNGTYRRGTLDTYIFEDLHQVRAQKQNWMCDYNHYRPHDALGRISPIKYAKIRYYLKKV